MVYLKKFKVVAVDAYGTEEVVAVCKRHAHLALDGGSAYRGLAGEGQRHSQLFYIGLGAIFGPPP